MASKKEDLVIEHHPWDFFIPDDAQTLIIGTFPTALRNWSFDFFYPNKRNLLWKILAEINESDLLVTEDRLEAVLHRKSILNSLKVGITDMGKCISREGGSSLDEKLCLIEAMDILDILNKHPTIKKIILTSSSGPSSALKWFLIYLKAKGIVINLPIVKKPLTFKLVHHNIKVDVYVLYSPSPRASNRISFPSLVEMYRNVIIDNTG